MSTSKDDIRRWFNTGVKEKARWLVVGCDTFDHGDYPIYFKENEVDECLAKIHELKSGKNMQKLMEVYDLNENRENQLNQNRSMNIPVKICCIRLSKEELEANSRASFIPIIKHQLDELTDEQRLSIINNYCKHCGTRALPCHCNNDE